MIKHEKLHDKLKNLPDKPGVYFLKDKGSCIIYVGKAVNLKNRVRQYWHLQPETYSKVHLMMEKVVDFDYIITDSELEALILECNLIKKHKPKYNILLKDDKHYPFLKITTNEPFPRIFAIRKIEKDGARYFGPYSNMAAIKDTISLVKKLFPVRTCKRNLPRDIGKDRPCLNYFIKQCPGPCRPGVGQAEYREGIKDIISFISGKQEDLVKKLKAEMEDAAGRMDFESAAQLRDRLSGLRQIYEKQKVLLEDFEDRDVIAYSIKGKTACVQIFFVRQGKLAGKEHFFLKVFQNYSQEMDSGALLSSFFKQFYTTLSYIPPGILVAHEFDDMGLVEEWLNQLKKNNKNIDGESNNRKVKIIIPYRGPKEQLLSMAKTNAEAMLISEGNEDSGESLTEVKKVKEMKEAGESLAVLLGIYPAPRRIEAYDISNTGKDDIAGSMTVFLDGFPARKEYKRFKIKTIVGTDDYGAIKEIVARRFKRYIETEAKAKAEASELVAVQAVPISTAVQVAPVSDMGTAVAKAASGFGARPGLIFIDGGKGHVSSVISLLDEMGLKEIPVFGLVKDRRHRTRGIALPSGEIIEEIKDASIMAFVTKIQNETHRFAINYNRKLGEKRYRESELGKIKGVGEKRRKALIMHFGSLESIKKAKIQELTEVRGLDRATAGRIYDHFHLNGHSHEHPHEHPHKHSNGHLHTYPDGGEI